MTISTIFKAEHEIMGLAEDLTISHRANIHICALIFQIDSNGAMSPSKTELVTTFGQSPLGVITCAEVLIEMASSMKENHDPKTLP